MMHRTQYQIQHIMRCMVSTNEQWDIGGKEGGQTSISRQQTLGYRQHQRAEHPAARVCTIRNGVVHCLLPHYWAADIHW
jgi:hypothetical protein